MKKDTKAFSIRLPWMVADELERYINGSMFRNRQHAFLVIVQEWLEAQRNKGKGQQVNLLEIKPPRKGKEK